MISQTFLVRIFWRNSYKVFFFLEIHERWKYSLENPEEQSRQMSGGIVEDISWRKSLGWNLKKSVKESGIWNLEECLKIYVRYVWIHRLIERDLLLNKAPERIIGKIFHCILCKNQKIFNIFLDNILHNVQEKNL